LVYGEYFEAAAGAEHVDIALDIGEVEASVRVDGRGHVASADAVAPDLFAGRGFEAGHGAGIADDVDQPADEERRGRLRRFAAFHAPGDLGLGLAQAPRAQGPELGVAVAGGGKDEAIAVDRTRGRRMAGQRHLPEFAAGARVVAE